MPQYTHLHNHTSLSLFDGAQTPGALARRVNQLGMGAAAITDHGACYGWPSFQKACEEVGIKPILGIEAYLVEDFDSIRELRQKKLASCTDRERKLRKTRFHQVLLAKTQEGLTNIMKLASWAADEGFYHEPTIDFRRLRKRSEGVIATSSCVQGILPQLALAGDPFGRWSKRERVEKAHEITELYLDIFEDDFYLEAHRHGIEDEETMNNLVQYLAGKYDIPVITANDCHYAREEDYRAQKAKTCISTSKTGNPTCFGDPEAGKYAHENMHIKSAEEMVGLFEEFPEAATNTMKIAEACEARLPMGKDEQFFPEFPGLGAAETAHERLIRECKAGFRRRCPKSPKKYQKRLRHELEVIGEMGFSDYFLIVADMVQFAKRVGIRVGPGRGSAAGSLVAYVLGITELDPVRHGLLFERFLNPARTTMPDIDIDFDDARREEIFRYIRQKYGEGRVARVITFDRYGLRSSVRNLGRIFGLEPTTRDEIAGHISALDEEPDTVAEATEKSGPLGRMRQEDERFAKVCDLVPKIKGLARHASQHPAAVVITPEEISSHVPTERRGTERNGGETVTQFDGDQLEDIGLLKMDVLGLKTLREIDVAMDIADGLGQKVSEEALKARNDPEVYADVFAAGDTQGIFQFASDGMQEALAEMEPSAYEHIVAMNALYRPGPMKLIPQFIARMRGEEETVYLAESVHDAVKGEVADILDETYGIMIFQEDVMRVARRLAGFSLSEADLLRQAISKKKTELLANQRENFVAGCREEGYSRELGETVFGLIEDFAGYALNKAHSASYSALAYKQAYLKCHHPTAFYAAALQVEDDLGERTSLVCGAKRDGIEVRRPSINESKRRFSSPEAGSIRFGLSTIKNVGEEADAFIGERERNGPFGSFLGCLTRCVPNARAVKALVKAGAFDEFGLSRAAMHSQAGEVLSYVRKHQDSCPASHWKDCSENSSGNQSGTPQVGNSQVENCQDRPEPPAVEDRPEWPPTKRFRAEREVAGIYTTGQPIDAFPELVEFYDGETWRRNHPRYGASDFKVRCGSILSVSEATTRNGQPMWWIRYMTDDGIFEEPVFKWRYDAIKNNLETDVAALIVSKADAQGEYAGMYSVENVVPMKDLKDENAAGHASPLHSPA
jgi:DNA polymerase-3 subunit alpha